MAVMADGAGTRVATLATVVEVARAAGWRSWPHERHWRRGVGGGDGNAMVGWRKGGGIIGGDGWGDGGCGGGWGGGGGGPPGCGTHAIDADADRAKTCNEGENDADGRPGASALKTSRTNAGHPWEVAAKRKEGAPRRRRTRRRQSSPRRAARRSSARTRARRRRPRCARRCCRPRAGNRRSGSSQVRRWRCAGPRDRRGVKAHLELSSCLAVIRVCCSSIPKQYLVRVGRE